MQIARWQQDGLVTKFAFKSDYGKAENIQTALKGRNTAINLRRVIKKKKLSHKSWRGLLKEW